MAEPLITLLRSLHGADGDAVEELLERVSGQLTRPVLSEHKWSALHAARGLFEPSQGFVAALARSPGPESGPVGARSGSAIGYAQLNPSGADGDVAVEVVVPPGRVDHESLSRALIATVLEEAAGDDGLGHVRLWIADPGPAADRLAASLGFVVERSLLQMRAALSGMPPATGGHPGVVLRTFVPGQDEEDWLKVNNRAFAGHPEQGDWDRAAIEERERAGWFDPSGFLVAETEGRMAGSCWTKIHAGADPPEGEIYVVAVDPDFHRKGLGRLLVTAGLASIVRSGVDRGMLYVDAANRSAVELYESLGFTTARVDRCYLRQLNADSDPISARCRQP